MDYTIRFARIDFPTTGAYTISEESEKFLLPRSISLLGQGVFSFAHQAHGLHLSEVKLKLEEIFQTFRPLLKVPEAPEGAPLAHLQKFLTFLRDFYTFLLEAWRDDASSQAYCLVDRGSLRYEGKWYHFSPPSVPQRKKRRSRPRKLPRGFPEGLDLPYYFDASGYPRCDFVFDEGSKIIVTTYQQGLGVYFYLRRRQRLGAAERWLAFSHNLPDGPEED